MKRAVLYFCMATILLTHREGDDSPLAHSLRAAGHAVRAHPLLTVTPAQSDSALQPAIAAAQTLVVTSRAAAARLAAFSLQGKHLVAIGEATAECLEGLGVTLHLPETATAHAMLDFLQKHRHDLPQPWLYLRGETVRTDLAALAATLGMRMAEMTIYRQRPDAEALESLSQALVGCSHAVLASRTVAENLAKAMERKSFPSVIWLAYSAVVAEPLTQGPIPHRVEVMSRPGAEAVRQWLADHS